MASEDTDERMARALQSLAQREGGVPALATELKCNAEYLRQVIRRQALANGKTRSIGPTIRRRLDHRFPGWMEYQHPSGGIELSVQGAQVMSYPPAKYRAFTLGDVMRVESLPAVFVVELTDDSMAPAARRGDHAQFSRDATPRPGDGVLVASSSGQAFFRIYRERQPGIFTAEPLSNAYHSLDSIADGLRVLGVLTGMPKTRWG